ncbi:MAG: DUF86 domain-containing protein [Deltaproteobacteria bacterium]
MTNVALVTRKLAILNEHLRRLRERRPPELSTLKSDALLQDAIALGILVVVQEAMDIALHIASDEGWELASTYRDAFVVLERHGLLEPVLTPSLVGAAQLRNRIAHGYASLDVERLWTELPSGIAAFAAFSARVAQFLGG